MSNRGYNSYNRRRPKKRITGRFYVFLTVMVVLVVMVGVLISNRGSRSTSQIPAQAQLNTSQAQPTDDPTQWTEADAETDETDADDQSGSDSSSGVDSIEKVLESDPDLLTVSESEKVQVSDLSINESLPSEWHNILLLGSDARNLDKYDRTDTIIIASINVNDGRVKLISVMRDLVVPIPGRGDRKINSASQYGGPELTMKVINQCFNLNISEYVLVNFSSFREVVDILGGVRLDVTKKEMEEINKGLKEQARLLNLSKEDYLAGKYNLTTYGPDTKLDGLQALSYARIRKIDSDWQRVERQRMVIDAVITQMRGSVSLTQIIKLATSIWEYIDTNVNMMSASGLATTVLRNGIGDIDSRTLPITDTYKSETRSSLGTALYDTDFETNATKLYQLIYEK